MKDVLFIGTVIVPCGVAFWFRYSWEMYSAELAVSAAVFLATFIVVTHLKRIGVRWSLALAFLIIVLLIGLVHVQKVPHKQITNDLQNKIRVRSGSNLDFLEEDSTEDSEISILTPHLLPQREDSGTLITSPSAELFSVHVDKTFRAELALLAEKGISTQQEQPPIQFDPVQSILKPTLVPAPVPTPGTESSSTEAEKGMSFMSDELKQEIEEITVLPLVNYPGTPATHIPDDAVFNKIPLEPKDDSSEESETSIMRPHTPSHPLDTVISFDPMQSILKPASVVTEQSVPAAEPEASTNETEKGTSSKIYRLQQKTNKKPSVKDQRLPIVQAPDEANEYRLLIYNGHNRRYQETEYEGEVGNFLFQALPFISIPYLNEDILLRN